MHIIQEFSFLIEEKNEIFNQINPIVQRLWLSCASSVQPLIWRMPVGKSKLVHLCRTDTQEVVVVFSESELQPQNISKVEKRLTELFLKYNHTN